jgi:hypothetical protein
VTFLRRDERRGVFAMIHSLRQAVFDPRHT